MNALIEPLLRTLHRRAWRRGLILATYAGYVVFAVSTYTVPLDMDGLAIRGTAFAVLAACYAMIHLAVQDTPARSDGPADEREEWVWQGAHRRAYGILSVLLFAAVGYVLVAIDHPARMLDGVAGDLLTEGLVALVLLALSLPTCIVAWTETDFAEDEVSDAAPARFPLSV